MEVIPGRQVKRVESLCLVEIYMKGNTLLSCRPSKRKAIAVMQQIQNLFSGSTSQKYNQIKKMIIIRCVRTITTKIQEIRPYSERGSNFLNRKYLGLNELESTSTTPINNNNSIL